MSNRVDIAEAKSEVIKATVKRCIGICEEASKKSREAHDISDDIIDYAAACGAETCAKALHAELSLINQPSPSLIKEDEKHKFESQRTCEKCKQADCTKMMHLCEACQETNYDNGYRMAASSALQNALSMLGYKGDAAEHSKWILERERAIRALRGLCERFGDNDWTDRLDLSSIIDKHLEDISRVDIAEAKAEAIKATAERAVEICRKAMKSEHLECENGCPEHIGDAVVSALRAELLPEPEKGDK